MADLHLAMPGDLWDQLGAGVETVGAAKALILKQLPILLFNRVIGLGIAQPATEQDVDQICNLYGGLGLRTGVQLAPTAQPPQLGEWLEKLGVNRTDTWGKLYRGTEPAAPVDTALRVEQIGEERAEEFGKIVAAAFRMPEPIDRWIAASIGRAGWHHYMALDGEKGVGVAALFVKDGVGSLGIAGTLPESRGKGAQSALIARRINDSIASGCRWLVVEADVDTPERPNPSYRNLLRFGFKLAYERQNYRS
jgi:hypothetical protein